MVWVPTKRMVADCLTKHLTQDEETKSIRDLLRDGHLHLRFKDTGVEQTLTIEQRKMEGLETSQRESAARPVPPEMDSEDEAALPSLLPPTGFGPRGSHGDPGVFALSKYTGVGRQAEKVLARHSRQDATTVAARPRQQKGTAGNPLPSRSRP